MSFEQPKFEEEKESFEEELSGEQKKEEYERMMNMVEEAEEVFEKRQDAKGLGILSRVGLNKKFKESDDEFDGLIDKIDGKLKKLGIEKDGMQFLIEASLSGDLKKRKRERLEENEDFQELIHMIDRARGIGKEKEQDEEKILADKEYIELTDNFKEKIEKLSEETKLPFGSIYMLAQDNYEKTKKEENKENVD